MFIIITKMKYEKFNDFWSQWTEKWYQTATITVDGKVVPVKDLCTFKKNYTSKVYKKYNSIKTIIKDSYFKNVLPDNTASCHLSRYKRASVITYTIIKSEPLNYKYEKKQPWLDPYFLKQRLAFYMAIGSIIQDFPEDQINKCKASGKPIYDFQSLGISNSSCSSNDEDDFLMSVYKDLLYSEIYDNFNVLTMANVYGLLTEKASSLCSE